MAETKDTQFDALFNIVLDIMPRHDEDFADHAEWFAKELFDRGVIVLPCKVGDTVYQVGRDFCDKRCHDKCDALCDGWDDLCPENNGELEVQTRVFTVSLFDKIGKEIFLTREEAEAALKRRVDNGSSG